MRIELVSMGYVQFVRRRMRREGLRITVRWGQVYTMGARTGTQPDSEAQMRARGVLARASEEAKREMEDEEKRLYWTTHAAEMGYKTARGACVAYHVRRLRELPQAEAIAALGRGVRRKRKEERLRRQEERRKREKKRIPLYVKHISTRGRKGKAAEMVRSVDAMVMAARKARSMTEKKERCDVGVGGT